MKKSLQSGAMRAFALNLGLLVSQSAFAVTITAGIDDNYAAPVDPANPSAELIARINDGFGTTANFDEPVNNQAVAHTFTGLSNNILTATLEVHIQGGSSVGVDTDGIIISFVDASTVTWPDSIAWARTFGDFAGGGTVFVDADPGIATPGVTWSTGVDVFLTLDLAALPLVGGETLNLIPLMNSYGFIDVTVADETITDFMRLTVSSVPIPAAVWLFGSGLIGLIGIARRKTHA